MSGQTQPETALQSLAEKLRTDTIAIFGEGHAERDIIEWFYSALLAAAPATPAAQGAVTHPLRYTNDGELAECPCCGSVDVGGAHDTVNCYGCGLQITKPRPLQNAADAWNRRTQFAVVVPGWNEAIAEAGFEALDELGFQVGQSDIGTDDLKTVFYAMLAAAPAHPAERQEQGEVHSAAARDVLAERRRQIEAEGWTPEHDDAYAEGDLAQAAGCYSLYAHCSENLDGSPADWPWPEEWWKPAGSRRNLVKAGALILAEIERLDRAARAASTAKQGEGEQP